MFNKIILVGNLTRDIELRYSQGGMGIAKTAIATSRKFTSNGEKKEEVCFVDITFFGRSAEVANQYLRKGSKILVEGRLNFEQWVDQNGQKRSKHSVIVETMQMLDSKGDNQGGGYNAPAQNSGYNAPAQGEPQGYQQPPAQQQQQSYQAPQQQNSYNNNQAASQSREMPSSNSIPEIDIDEDEIPF
ncbi:single-stranded DNA-binding protein [Sulfurimonas sediminis]|uniref:Single-stranded DNA-binding protein n=1 Tax=Sulfurimonas sediminis TaxID=2590020 RepID=A0A7M1B3B7_9BACT|nr:MULTISPECIES: single-stranded DNA-binding protein [Sulfurimonas]QOP44221.1 single-stranded DNA-binding protein [Sulfurimonas sediminis]UCM99815.1 single-stranded DNA-binding protein [Sulfurimonas sp. SWIR-19]